MGIIDIVDKRNIMLDIEAESKQDIFKVMAKSLHDTGVVININGFIEDVFKREKEFSTGIGFQIAIPHAKSKYVKKSAIALARLKNPIEYESLDDEPVSLLFMIAVPETKNNEHLKILSMLSRKFMDSEFRENLINAKDKDEIFEVLNVV